MRRGDICLCDFGDPIGHEQGFNRPAVLISHDEMSRHGLPIVLPISRTKRGYATHIELDDELPVTSYVQCEQIRVVSNDRLIRKVATVDGMVLLRAEQILRRILSL